MCAHDPLLFTQKMKGWTVTLTQRRSKGKEITVLQKKPMRLVRFCPVSQYNKCLPSSSPSPPPHIPFSSSSSPPSTKSIMENIISSSYPPACPKLLLARMNTNFWAFSTCRRFLVLKKMLPKSDLLRSVAQLVTWADRNLPAAIATSGL